MASFQVNIGWKRVRNRESENYHSVSFPTRSVIENSKKIAKKFRKLKNTTMASFHAKIGWKRPRKREKQNYRSVLFLPDA